MAVYVTGDIHGSHTISKLNTDNFPEGKDLTKQDYVIVCGDFGIPWGGKDRFKADGSDSWWLKWLDEKPWTTLFVDGNHENFPLLYSYPVIDKFGGKVHKLNDSVFHLMRGQVLEIGGKTFFCMGGASSHDKEWRTMDIDLWEQELPSDKEYEEAMEALEKANYQVDYVITHCLPDGAMNVLGTWYEHDKLSNFLEYEVVRAVVFDKWFCGHFHMDKPLKDGYGNRFNILYHDIIQIG